MTDTTKLDWNTKQAVGANIVDQLSESTADEQKALILKLLDKVSPDFLLALDFAYSMTPNQKRGSKTDKHAMTAQEQMIATVQDDLRREGIEARHLEQCERTDDFINSMHSIIDDLIALTAKYQTMLQAIVTGDK